ncbi:MAG TPA: site-specific integrase [Thermodesulfovibrionales bacterium]|nr:site-specific integrase [Thermodesulfovibrionales bacterium]
MTFQELWEHYRRKYEKKRDGTSSKHLLPYFGEMTLAEISPEDVEDYVIDRQESPLNPADSTIYQEFSLGRRMFNVARKVWKWTSENPFADIFVKELLDLDNARDRWLLYKEEVILLAYAERPDYLYDLIIFAIHTGCRRGEILSLTWHDNIDLFRKTIKVEISKRKKRDKGNLKKKYKTIPMSDTLFNMLLRRSKVMHISGRVFPISASSARHAFDEAVKRAGIKNFHFHDLRHTFATRLVQAGVNLYTVKELMGHESIKTTERYAHHYPESLRPSVMVLDEVPDMEKMEQALKAAMKKASGENS